MSYLGKMPQRVVFSLILLLAILLTGLRDSTSLLPRQAVADAELTAPGLALAAR